MSAQSAILFLGLFSRKPEWEPGSEAVQSEYTTMTANRKERVKKKIISEVTLFQATMFTYKEQFHEHQSLYVENHR